MHNKVNALLVIVFGSALDAITTELLDGDNFNFTTGIKRLACIAVVGGIIAACSLFVSRGTSKKGSGE